jgi:putative ABC transport system permease protein
MSRKSLFMRLLIRAAWGRRDRAFTALLSIAVVATMTTVALTVYSDLEVKLSREFRNFGANAIVTARDGSLSDDALTQIKNTLGNQGEAVPVGYAIVQTKSGSPVVMGGTNLERFKALNSWWSVTPVSGSGQALVGARAAENLSPKGQPFAVTYNGKTLEVQPGVIFHSGSEDDSRIYVDLQQFENLTSSQPNTAQLRIEGTPAEIQQRIQQLSASLPQTEIKPVRQITAAQTAVLGRTRSVVIAASAVVVVLIVLCMVATLTGAVLERRKDFAVMKALGASDRTVNMLFAGEAALISVVGALIGFILGTGIAYWIGRANFGTAISPRPELLGPVVVGSVVLALVAATAPLNLLRRIQPAGILRGE